MLVVAPLVRGQLMYLLEAFHGFMIRRLLIITLTLVHKITQITLLLEQCSQHDSLVLLSHFLLEPLILHRKHILALEALILVLSNRLCFAISLLLLSTRQLGFSLLLDLILLLFLLFFLFLFFVCDLLLLFFRLFLLAHLSFVSGFEALASGLHLFLASHTGLLSL